MISALNWKLFSGSSILFAFSELGKELVWQHSLSHYTKVAGNIWYQRTKEERSRNGTRAALAILHKSAKKDAFVYFDKVRYLFKSIGRKISS